MYRFRNSLISSVLVLLAVATYVVLAGREEASPTTSEATPISCLSQVHECVTATLGQTLMSQRSQHGVSFGQMHPQSIPWPEMVSSL